MLTLKFVFNFSNGEAATILGKTEGAIKSLQHRALVSLQKQIEKREAGPDVATLHGRGTRGRHRRPVRRREDVALHRADQDGRRRVRKDERRHGADRRRAPRRARRGRSGAEDHARDDPRPGRARHRRRPAREPPPGRRAARRARAASARRADPDDDLETLKLELLVADRDHVERRLERVEKQAKSGDAKLRAEVEELEKVLAHVDAGGTLADYAGELPGELEPLTTKPLLAVENGPAGSTSSSRPSSPSCPTRRRPRSATAASRHSTRSRGRLARRARPDHVLHGRREGHAGLDAAQRPDGARRRGDDPHRHRARLHPLRGGQLAATSSSSARMPRSRARACRGSRARPTSSRTATC